MNYEDAVKQTIKIEWTDNAGQKHVSQRELFTENNIEFIDRAFFDFLKMTGLDSYIKIDTDY
jgi:hypothetical protein